MSSAVISHWTGDLNAPTVVLAAQTAPGVLLLIFSEPMLVGSETNPALYDTSNYVITGPPGSDPLTVISVWGYGPYAYPYPYTYPHSYGYGVYPLGLCGLLQWGWGYDQVGSYSYAIAPPYPWEGGLYSVFVMFDGEPTYDDIYTIRTNSGPGGPTDISGNRVAPWHNSAQFRGIPQPRLLSVEMTKGEDLPTIHLTFNVRISPGDRDLYEAYVLRENVGDAVVGRIVGVGAPREEAVAEYDIYASRLSHHGRYALDVDVCVETEDGWVIAPRSAIFSALGVVPSFTVTPESNSSLLLRFSEEMVISPSLRDPDNYIFTGGLRTTAVQVISPKEIRLFTTVQTKDSYYTLKVGREASD